MKRILACFFFVFIAGCGEPLHIPGSWVCPEGEIREEYEEITARTKTLLAEIDCSTVISDEAEEQLLEVEDELVEFQEEFPERYDRPRLYKRCPKTIGRCISQVRLCRQP